MQTAEHVVGIRHNSHMTPDEYRRERERLDATYGKDGRQAANRRAQELAKLFDRSGWTQEQLAEAEGKSTGWTSYQLQFGAFLNFFTTVRISKSAPFWWLPDLTERRFRTFWAAAPDCGGNDRQRFQRVLDALCSLPPNTWPVRDGSPARAVGKTIRNKFGDGEWHKVEEIAEDLGADAEQIHSHLDMWFAGSGAGASSVDVERKKVGKSFAYRMFDKKRSVSPIEIKQKLSPLIRQLKDECGKSEARLSRPTLALIATRLQKLIEEWESAPEAGGVS